jgi:nucleoside-diphosphate-sugar epimerase
VSAANQVFLLADASPVSTCQLAKIIAKIENKKIRLFSVPQFLIKLFCFLIGKASFSDRLLKNLEVSSLKATRLIGWKPKFSIEEQLDKS